MEDAAVLRVDASQSCQVHELHRSGHLLKYPGAPHREHDLGPFHIIGSDANTHHGTEGSKQLLSFWGDGCSEVQDHLRSLFCLDLSSRQADVNL